MDDNDIVSMAHVKVSTCSFYVYYQVDLGQRHDIEIVSTGVYYYYENQSLLTALQAHAPLTHELIIFLKPYIVTIM